MISEAQMFFSFTSLLTFNLVSRQTLSKAQWNLFLGKKPHEDRFGKRAKNVLILKLKTDLNFISWPGGPPPPSPSPPHRWWHTAPGKCIRQHSSVIFVIFMIMIKINDNHIHHHLHHNHRTSAPISMMPPSWVINCWGGTEKAASPTSTVWWSIQCNGSSTICCFNVTVRLSFDIGLVFLQIKSADYRLYDSSPHLVSIQPREDKDSARSFGSDHLSKAEHDHLLAGSHLPINTLSIIEDWELRIANPLDANPVGDRESDDEGGVGEDCEHMAQQTQQEALAAKNANRWNERS